MVSPQSHSFWMMNHLANHIVRPLFGSSLGTRIGRHLALLRVPGRQTGHIYEFPVQVRGDDEHGVGHARKPGPQDMVAQPSSAGP